MRIIAFRILREFWKKNEYADSETSLRSWYHDAKSSNWKNPNLDKPEPNKLYDKLT